MRKRRCRHLARLLAHISHKRGPHSHRLPDTLGWSSFKRREGIVALTSRPPTTLTLGSAVINNPVIDGATFISFPVAHPDCCPAFFFPELSQARNVCGWASPGCGYGRGCGFLFLRSGPKARSGLSLSSSISCGGYQETKNHNPRSMNDGERVQVRSLAVRLNETEHR